MSEQDASRSAFNDTLGLFWYLVFLLHSWAAVMHLFLRIPGTCGQHYFGMLAFCGWVWMLLYTQLFFAAAPGAMIVWYTFLATIPLLVLHRILAIRARRRGETIHSHYVGKSWAEKLFPFLKPYHCKPGMELVICLGVGFCLMSFAPALGSFLMLGGFANFIQMDLITIRDRRKVDAMEDALLEQEYLAELLQERLRRRQERQP